MQQIFKSTVTAILLSAATLPTTILASNAGQSDFEKVSLEERAAIAIVVQYVKTKLQSLWILGVDMDEETTCHQKKNGWQ